MIKVLTWFSRKPGMTVDDFRGYWRDEHPKAVLRMPGLRAYNQNPTADSGYAKGNPYCDGIAETWWDDLDAIRAQRGTAELDALMIDEAEFIDPARRQQLVVSEVVINDVEITEGALKQITWLRRRSDLTPEQCHDYWRDHHGPLALRIPGLGRYVQNHVVPSQYRNGRTPPFDGAAIVHLADLDLARRAGTSEEMAATLSDNENFVDTDNMPWIIASEVKIV